MRFCDIDAQARDLIDEAGYSEYWRIRLGHFIGQEDHEYGDVSPINKNVAEPGMIFSIEPGIYIEGKYGGVEVALPAGEKVTVRHGANVEYATTRANEHISELLRRLQISVSPLEMVLVDVSGEEISVTVDSDFTYYETASERVEHTTLYTPTGRLPKGEVEIVQQGIDGVRNVVYEVVYADGQLVSRQAVEESGNTSVAELAYLGTRVSEAQEGDTVSSVVYEEDGGGYLLMTSGDSLHFSRAVEVKCTAYTAGYDGVGTRTATGTTVRRGVVAVDKRVFPLGSALYVDVKSNAFQYGMAYAEDTGMRGEKLDLYMDSYEECILFGVRKATVYVLD